LNIQALKSSCSLGKIFDMKTTCFTLCFIINVWGGFGFTCNRIRFVTDSKHPYGTWLDAVYVRINRHQDGRPVFESEKGGMYVAYSARKKEWYLAQGTSSFRDRVALYLDRKGLFRVKECSPDEKNRNVCSWTKTRAKIKCADSMTDCESRPLLIKVYHNNILQLREILTQKPRQSYYYHSDDKRMEIRKTNNFWYGIQSSTETRIDH